MTEIERLARNICAKVDERKAIHPRYWADRPRDSLGRSDQRMLHAVEESIRSERRRWSTAWKKALDAAEDLSYSPDKISKSGDEQ